MSNFGVYHCNDLYIHRNFSTFYNSIPVSVLTFVYTCIYVGS